MSCTAILAEDGPIRRLSPDEAAAYSGPGFVWVHIEGGEDASVGLLAGHSIPEIAANALVARETRPRCEAFADGALINLRGPGLTDVPNSDRLVSIRMWARAGKVNSLTRRRLAATDAVTALMEAGAIQDPGDLVAAFARTISKQLDPQVAALGDRLDDCESALDDPRSLYGLRTEIARIRAEAIAFRRFVAPNRDALETLAALNAAWLSDEDRIHIREAGDRFARMAEELEAVRERSALLHEQLTDLRSEHIDQRSLVIAVFAFIFLPLTFITGLLGMNVAGIPYAEEPWAFWGVVAFCLLVGAAVFAWFVRQHWLRR